MTIAFDDAAAGALVSAADVAEATLRGQGHGRQHLVSLALLDFEGTFARAFTDAVMVEADDRGRLARGLYRLAEQVREASQSARKERDRLAAIAAWEAREALRRENSALTPVTVIPASWGDPRPSDHPVAPPDVSASFIARDHPRSVANWLGGGRCSADPERLRSFATNVVPLDAALDEHLGRVRAAWTGFTATCSWVAIERATLFDGWRHLVDENAKDAAWVRAIADAFDRAGSGTLSDLDLALGTCRTFPQSTAELLTGGMLTVEQVALAWATLAQSPALNVRAFIRRWADVLGSLEGLPALVRVEANRCRVPGLLRAAAEELADLENSDREDDLSRAEMIRNEIAYLTSVQNGQVQLYLYDRDESRIVEMIGTPGPDTTKAITYVPGTFTGLNSFYAGGVQRIAKHLTVKVPGAVAFVYKDGKFPGEQNNANELDLGRIVEANHEDTARHAGEQLAQFQEGMRSDPSLGGVEQIGIGHSWGVVDLTSSEVAGARYDKVISLADAGMLPGWEPRDETSYMDYSYYDILIHAQSKGLVWEGKTPRGDDAFQHGALYEGPDDEKLKGGFINAPGDIDVLTNNHNLIATDQPKNHLVLRDLRKEVSG